MDRVRIRSRRRSYRFGLTIVTQRIVFRRTDEAIRRKLRARLSLVIPELRRDTTTLIHLPTFRRCLTDAVERSKQTGVWTALKESQFISVLRATDSLQSLMVTIAAEEKEMYALGYQHDFPSERDYFSVDETLERRLLGSCEIVEQVIKAIGKT